LSATVNGQNWRVCLDDSGPGLPPDRISDVFEPFVRVPLQKVAENNSGTGLGLAICRSIMDLHKGSIHAENHQPGPGLRVVFEIPLVAKPVLV
jgi:signal transduction histidine kinase